MSIESNIGFGTESVMSTSNYKKPEASVDDANIASGVAQEQATAQQIAQEVKRSDERVDIEDSRRAAEALIKVAQNLNQDIQFSLDASQTGSPVVQVVDRESGAIIRQIPSEEFLNLASSMQSLTDDDQIDSATGLLIDSHV